MGSVTSSSLAAINAVGIENQQFAVSSQNVEQKNIIIGTFDESSFPLLTPNIPIRVLSSQDVGAKTGFGYMLHRLALSAEKAGKVQTWIIPQEEGGSDPDQATGEIDFSASTGVLAGTANLYIAGALVSVGITAGLTPEVIGDYFQDAINDNDDLPITAINTLGVLAITSKSGGPWGNDISLVFNLAESDELPDGMVAAITGMSGGVGTPDIQDALDALGTGDAQNEKNFTNLIHGYGNVTAVLDAVSTYNGPGNDLIGNYTEEVARPLRSMVGNTAVGSAGFAAALVFADLRGESDRTNGYLQAPGSPNHPQEIAAQATGIAAVTNSKRAAEGYIDKALYGVWPGDMADRWTNDYSNRDQAVKGGLATTMSKNGVLLLQNIDTFYRPTSISVESNGYRKWQTLSIIQNVLYNFKANFERDYWKGIIIVEDAAKISSLVDREKVRDSGNVLDDLFALADSFYGKGWVYNSSYIKENCVVSLRAGLTGWDIKFPFIPSGEGGITNSLITFDTSITVLSGGA